MSIKKVIKLNPSQLLVLVFVVSIVLGTLLLKLPISTNKSITVLDAFFIATSAMTVTGLTTVDVGATFTVTGKLIIAMLIQIGGLGIMSFGILIFIILGKKIGLKERIVLQHALNQTNIGGIIKLVKYVFVFSITIELIAMVFLSVRWIPQFGVLRGLFYSFFHSISAFNNAGISLMSDNLMKYVGDPIVNIVISFLIIIGGIGFTVLIDLWKKRNVKRLSLHSKLMLLGTLIINLIAMIVIFCMEYNNPNTLGGLSEIDKIWASYFQAISPRTAGFNTIDIGSLEDTTLFFMMVLMFIGAGSGSTAGGIKLTTALIIILAMIAFFRGKSDINIWKRTINSANILKALSITMASIIVVVLAIMILSITEHISFVEVMFEVVSAFGTVGLSTGITGTLSPIGKQVLIFMMFLGKLGPLTLVYSLAKPSREKVRYPNEDIFIG